MEKHPVKEQHRGRCPKGVAQRNWKKGRMREEREGGRKDQRLIYLPFGEQETKTSICNQMFGFSLSCKMTKMTIAFSALCLWNKGAQRAWKNAARKWTTAPDRWDWKRIGERGFGDPTTQSLSRNPEETRCPKNKTPREIMAA